MGVSQTTALSERPFLAAWPAMLMRAERVVSCEVCASKGSAQRKRMALASARHDTQFKTVPPSSR